MEGSGVIEGLKSAGKKLVKGYFENVVMPPPERIPAEQITDSAVADAIIKWHGNWKSHLNTLSKPTKTSPFSIAWVLRYEGYTPIWSKPISEGVDFQSKFPKEYAATRAALIKLCQEQALTRETGPIDENKESMQYRIANEELLRQIAAREENSRGKPFWK